MISTCESILTLKDIINGFTSPSLVTRISSARKSNLTSSILLKAHLSIHRVCAYVLARDQVITVGVRAERTSSTKIHIRSDKAIRTVIKSNTG